MNTHENDRPHSKTIIHIDIDCFYAQVEMVLNPSLRHKPIGIKQKNFLVTSNYIAREMGLRKCMYVKDAVKQLPSLVLIDGSDLTNYRKFSSDIFQLLQSYTNLVEKLGFDENFLDVSDLIEEDVDVEISCKIFGDEVVSPSNVFCACGCFERLKAGAILANKIRGNILETTGLTCCAGIAHNKLLAKLACSQNKPNDQTIVFPWQAIDLMNSLATAKDIPGIGSITFKGLNKLDVFTVSDLQNASVSRLSQHFSPKMSESLISLAYGDDSSLVRPSGLPATLGVEDAFAKVDSASEVREKCLVLAKRLLRLLEADGRIPGCLKVTLRKVSNDQPIKLHRETKQVPINISIFLKSDEVEKSKNIAMLAFNTFEKMVDRKKPFHLTLLGLGLGRLEKQPANRETNFNFFKRQKSETQLSSECVGAKPTSPPIRSSPSTVVANEINLKDVCANFGDGIRLHVDSTPGNTSTYSSPKGYQLPPNIDRTVFDALPASIQRDILNDYSRHMPGSTSPSKGSSLKQTKLSDFFTKK